MLLTPGHEASTLRAVRADETPVWIHVEAPTDEEAKTLTAAGLPAVLVEHALDVDEVPRVDHESGYELVVLRVLVTGPASTTASTTVGGTSMRARTVALGVLLTPERVFTITRGPTDIAEAVATSCAAGPITPVDVLLAIITAMAEQFLAAVRGVDRVVDALEEKLGTSQGNLEVLLLLEQQKALVRLSTALRANRVVADRLVTDEKLGLDDDARERLDDALIELHQAIEMVTVSTDILIQMMDAFASIISNNLNRVMKVLTALTLVLTGPLLLASLYGMNVPLPGQAEPWAFPVLLTTCVLLGLGVAGLFRKRGWL